MEVSLWPFVFLMLFCIGGSAGIDHVLFSGSPVAVLSVMVVIWSLVMGIPILAIRRFRGDLIIIVLIAGLMLVLDKVQEHPALARAAFHRWQATGWFEAARIGGLIIPWLFTVLVLGLPLWNLWGSDAWDQWQQRHRIVQTGKNKSEQQP